MKRDSRNSKNSNQISISQSARNAKNWAKLWKAIENDKGKALKLGYPDRPPGPFAVTWFKTVSNHKKLT